MTNVLNNHPDHEIIALAVALAQEMAAARGTIAAIPDDADIKTESDGIAAAILPAEDIANRLQGMVAVTPEGEFMRGLADAYLNA